MSGLIESEYVVITSDTAVAGVGSKIHAVTVVVATATNVITIRDGVAAAGGVLLHSIPASSGINYRVEFDGEKMVNGLYVDFTGTGTVRVAFTR